MTGALPTVTVFGPPGSVIRTDHSLDDAGAKVIDVHVHLWDLSGEVYLAAGRQSDVDTGHSRKLDAIGGGKLVFVSDAVPLAELAQTVGRLVDHGVSPGEAPSINPKAP